MNTPTENTENTTRTRRPGYWLRAIEFRNHQLGREQRRAMRDQLADQAREGISDEDYATTMATLEKMARNLGFDETEFEDVRHGRGFGPGKGFGPGFAPAFGPGGRRHFGRGFGPRHPGFDRHENRAENTQRPETDAPRPTES